MEDCKLVFPNLRNRERAIAFIDEFRMYHSEINGSGGLDRYLETSTYEAWLAKLYADMDIANIPDNRVPALTYFYVREADDEIVGMVNLRLILNDFLKAEGGHIGYCVRPTERRKHYATEMLNAALRVYDRLEIRDVLVSCDKSNIASAKVIENCGGILEAEFYSEAFKAVIQRYCIHREI